ncbi:isocitrate lyase/PEP mutase family protein [Aestuariispira insulae]|uniref:2-methylisocitrate lyase-like PEP mutase family enzyme n=1 Tax=Aestuariispira insulae TaxID=1461337 RepID=A0A3D9HPX9_9PROT|nr:isocitrate lyase/PEP mutase family protein [Aestuariispira insulae]RED51547.1 2-methylisocitrate lyase-like PEP mutase family enzyme [Aestuariispira insulae]
MTEVWGKELYGAQLRQRVSHGGALPLIGIFDLFSASLAARHFEAVFCSGYGFAASYYGLPDEGYIAWPDMVAYVERIRAVLPDQHIVVDIDDGYGDPKLAANTVKRLERVGASAVILEDQRRPKKCGHLPGKDILDTDDYLKRLDKVLDVREDLCVIARTDATTLEEGIRRAKLYATRPVDGILVEGVPSLEVIPEIREAIGPDLMLTINLIAGGKTPPVTVSKLQQLGASLVIYSTPCLFLAQQAIDRGLAQLKADNGKFTAETSGVPFQENISLMAMNGLSATSRPAQSTAWPDKAAG